jgi:hypothetical protein
VVYACLLVVVDCGWVEVQGRRWRWKRRRRVGNSATSINDGRQPQTLCTTHKKEHSQPCLGQLMDACAFDAAGPP